MLMGLNHQQKKRIKMFEYFRDKVSNNGIILLQETHSAEDAHKWWDDFQGQIFFFHGTTNSCGWSNDSLSWKQKN